MVWSLFGRASEPPKEPKEQVREWTRKLRHEMRGIDRSIRSIDFEERKVVAEIKAAAKRNDVQSCKVLAKEVVRSRNAKTRLNESKAHMNSVAMSLQSNLATMRMADHLKTSTDVMQSMSKLIRYPEVAKVMGEMAGEMTKMGLIEEMVSDAVDSMDAAGVEEEADEEVQKVLSEVAAGVLGQLPAAAGKLPAQAQPQAEVAEGEGDIEERLNAL
ncbi:unnamed protein product [Vitrella brassicaformis CCMP3155]|uniref:Charged multivesicular body protein 3 n=1 Tax=Vitrella brassicaformis (strain CCMP3155) TaxID=1169540 RepID=A0A0G4G3M3_VITBC|nr:unnamed protein product [Vitrella brassicaformis CCMP3155]|mmetsp:Transcript_27161/g.67739  ORF Transcript_27161/g.67739 Transcript_27161/m.67739 type:complete len:215 (-) Transcript_27161:439-1083(-)|eukprot:CEM22760.1 unnamed protein product [Vitrella brassicaformis CCMP3155]